MEKQLEQLEGEIKEVSKLYIDSQKRTDTEIDKLNLTDGVKKEINDARKELNLSISNLDEIRFAKAQAKLEALVKKYL